MRTWDQILFAALAILGFFGPPTFIVWGWARWLMRPKQWTIISILSLTGFILATLSSITALCAIGHAGEVHYFDPMMWELFRLGVLISLTGIVLGLAGVWRGSPLRWHSPISSVTTLALWFMMTMMA
jgi:hypothetical protein